MDLLHPRSFVVVPDQAKSARFSTEGLQGGREGRHHAAQDNAHVGKKKLLAGQRSPSSDIRTIISSAALFELLSPEIRGNIRVFRALSQRLARASS